MWGKRKDLVLKAWGKREGIIGPTMEGIRN